MPFFFQITEHQIRLCDDNKVILEKLHLSSAQNKKTDVFYAESPDRTLSASGLSIRIKQKQNKAEVTVKKRLYQAENLPLGGQIICENDLHGGQKNRTCKIDSSIEKSEFQQVLSGKKPVQEILSRDQREFLARFEADISKTVLYGTLAGQRYQWIDKRFGEVTLDLVEQKGKEEIRYHEISIRYDDSDKTIGSQFDSFLSGTEIKTCPDQIKWPVNKFDTLEIVN